METRYTSLFPARCQSKLPAVAKKIDGEKFTDDQSVFAIRRGAFLDVGIKTGRLVEVAHLEAAPKTTDKSPDFIGLTDGLKSGVRHRVAVWLKTISQGNLAGRKCLRVALTPL